MTVLGVQQSVSNVSLNGMAVPSSSVDYNETSKALVVTGLNNMTSGGAYNSDWVLKWDEGMRFGQENVKPPQKNTC